MAAPKMPRFRGSSDVALLVLRVAAGLMMAFYGWSKISGGLGNFKLFYESLGLPLSGIIAYVIPFLELIGGLLIVVGLLSRLPALLLGIEMVLTGFVVKLTIMNLVGYTAAFAPADLAQGTQVPAPAVIDMLFLATFITIVLMGPGRYALDYVLGIERGEAEAPALGRAKGARKVA